MLHKHIGSFAGVDVEVLFHLATLRAAKRRIGKNHMLAVTLLNIGKVLGKCVAPDDVRRLKSVKNEVHRSNDIGQRLLFLAIEGFFLQFLGIGSALDALLHVGECLAQESGRTASRVIDRFANFGVNHLHNGAYERSGCVVLAAVTASIAHLGNLRLIEHRHFVLILGTLEVQLVYEVNHFAQIVTRGNLVAQLRENLAYLVFQCLGTCGCVLELC